MEPLGLVAGTGGRDEERRMTNRLKQLRAVAGILRGAPWIESVHTHRDVLDASALTDFTLSIEGAIGPQPHPSGFLSGCLRRRPQGGGGSGEAVPLLQPKQHRVALNMALGDRQTITVLRWRERQDPVVLEGGDLG